MSNLTPKQAALVEDGRSQQYVAEVMGINQSSVSTVLRRFRETERYNRRPVSGRPRCTNPADDHYLRIQTLWTRHVTARQLQNVVSGVRNIRISVNTVRNRLRNFGIRPRMLVTAPLLTRAHRVAPLKLAREQVNWDINH